MNASREQFPFADWWDAVLRKDAEAERRERAAVAPSSMLQCVFCAYHLENDIREAGKKGDQAAMLAWWRREDHSRIVAAGLYCHGSIGDGSCWQYAERAGFLLDAHVEPYCRPRAGIHRLENILASYPDWDGNALRRLTLILLQLGKTSAERIGR
jgi:hypothetical protein